jgi:hypothetical protein
MGKLFKSSLLKPVSQFNANMATIHAMFALNWLTGFRGEDFKTFFPIRSSAEGGHLGWRSGSLDTILKIDHLRTIHAMFALNWLQTWHEWSLGGQLSNLCPVTSTSIQDVHRQRT